MVIFGILTLLTFILMLWQFAEAMFFPLNQRNSQPSFSPGMTVLKPLKGCDAATASCLSSWLDQNYDGPVQILFGVASMDDPVCELVRKLFSAKPNPRAQLHICPEQLGANAKVSTLVQLERLAQHDIIVISDADVQVPSDLLQQLLTSFQDTTTGLVSCLYRQVNPANLAMRMEAFAINADFWSQVLQAQRLKPLDFALGATMAVKRESLAQIGGFSALLDYLADDYELGHRVAGTGRHVVLCPIVVECCNFLMSWQEVWNHQLRWARTIRVCRPGSYFLSILNDATLWPVLWLLASRSAVALVGSACCVGIRMVTGILLEQKFTDKISWSALWIAPIKDLLNVFIWLFAFLGNRVTWRGQRFQVTHGGKLIKSED